MRLPRWLHGRRYRHSITFVARVAADPVEAVIARVETLAQLEGRRGDRACGAAQVVEVSRVHAPGKLDLLAEVGGDVTGLALALIDHPEGVLVVASGWYHPTD